MRTLLYGAAGLLALSSVAAAIAEPKVVGFNFEKQKRSDSASPQRLARRQKTVQAAIGNYDLLYLINVTIGTPPKLFGLQLDTGSSDIWVPANNADFCLQERDGCALGSYDAGASSTSHFISNGFRIGYVDGSQISGDYVADTLAIGNTKITNLTMGIASTASRGLGIMGIGYSAGESSAEVTGQEYPNIINQLKNEGFINTLAYSLWLNDFDANTGSILFGGVDKAKYHGDLIALPVQLDGQTGNLTSFTVAWTGLSVSSGGQSLMSSTNIAQPAILDSGTTDLLLPSDMYTSLATGFGVQSSPRFGDVVPCKLAGSDATFSFSFGGSGGPTVNVSLNQFVTPIFTTSKRPPKFPNGDDACSWGISDAGTDPILFGDTFLRSAYVVYDLENNLIGLAQTNFNATSSNIQEFSSSASGIPGASSTATAVTVTQTFSGHPLQTQGATATATDSQIAGGTARSATFKLASATASSSTAASGTHSGAAGHVSIPAFTGSSLYVSLVTLLGVAFGGLAFVL